MDSPTLWGIDDKRIKLDNKYRFLQIRTIQNTNSVGYLRDDRVK